jgi:hypothetical protein
MLRGFPILVALCAPLLAQAAEGIVTIEANVPAHPPGWAALERRLLDALNDAALAYAKKYLRPGGTLIWRTSGGASLDDLPESFYNFPLLYALGGDERFKDISFHAWNDTIRQLTYYFPTMHNEFAKHGDWFHIGEGIIYFYLLPLADPTDHETVLRARRYAGLYMNESPEAANYDSKLKIIRSPHTGSLGPVLGDPAQATPYHWSKGMASYGLPFNDLPGIKTYDDLKDPGKAREMGRAMQQRMYRGDVPANMAAAALMANAFIHTGEAKYAAWIKEYVGAWLDHTRANGGITPDNIGLSGKVGEHMDGKWWGGLYGWNWPHGYYNISIAAHIAAASAMLVDGGNAAWLELPRSNMDQVMSRGKNFNGHFVVPYKKGDGGWHGWQPMERSLAVSLWYQSQDRADLQRLDRLRAASTADWHTATGTPFPNRGYAMKPEYREDCWYCDVEGKIDWNYVANMRNKEDRGHEAPWARFLAGENPDYPERMLGVSYGHVTRKLDQIRRNVLSLEYDSRRTTSIDPAGLKIQNVHEHHWQMINPVTTEALVQLMLGAPQIMYNGGLLHATVRYFDAQARRPGLPPDVAALVRKVEPDHAVLELVNLSPLHAREVIVQAGAFGEHQFTSVKHTVRTDQEPLQPEHFALVEIRTGERSVEVNRRFFAVRMPAGTTVTLDMGMKRFANQPTYAFPWHGDRPPVE